MPFLLIRDDITKVRADAIVNPANTGLEEGRGTSRGIYVAAGEEKLREACQRIGHCDEGKAVITDGFDLPARYIIHAVGPVWQGGVCGEDQVLYNTYIESMALARKKGLESIAFPLLSAGNYGFPKVRAMRIAMAAIKDYIGFYDMTVYLVVYDAKTVAISKKLFTSIEEYIDEHYVENKNENFAGTANLPQGEGSPGEKKLKSALEKKRRKEKKRKKLPWPLSLFQRGDRQEEKSESIGEDMENTGSLPPLPLDKEETVSKDMENTGGLPCLSFDEEETVNMEQEVTGRIPPLPLTAREIIDNELEDTAKIPPLPPFVESQTPPPSSFMGSQTPSSPPTDNWTSHRERSVPWASAPPPGSFRRTQIPPENAAPPPASGGPPSSALPRSSGKPPKTLAFPRFSSSKEKKRRLDDIMTHMGETFSQMLIRLIDERGLTDPAVYHKANIDRKLFSKIRNNKDYSPNKKTIIAFAIALELSLDETKDLLRTAGYSLSDSSRFDVIISFFLENNIYDIFEINEMLFFYEQPVLGSA